MAASSAPGVPRGSCPWGYLREQAVSNRSPQTRRWKQKTKNATLTFYLPHLVMRFLQSLPPAGSNAVNVHRLAEGRKVSWTPSLLLHPHHLMLHKPSATQTFPLNQGCLQKRQTVLSPTFMGCRMSVLGSLDGLHLGRKPTVGYQQAVSTPRHHLHCPKPLSFKGALRVK